MEVKRVSVQLRLPTATDVGQVTEGFYVVRDGLLTLTRPDGSPLVTKDGTPLNKSHTLKPNDNPESIAQVLTRKARRELLGLTEAQEAFSRPLQYATVGVA
jgi:hypothetical protein